MMIDDARKGQISTPGGDLGAFEFEQSIPASTWTIPHNLGYEPAITLFTTGGQEFKAGVVHSSLNVSVVSLASPLAGRARCA